jgi:RNA polymerase sigma factor (sigma-70 family)
MDLSEADTVKRIDDAIGDMPQEQRDAFLLHRLEVLDYPEIAERLGIDVEQVEQHVAAALKMLRRAVER